MISVIYLVAGLLLFAFLTLLKGVAIVEQDQEYGYVGLGSMDMSAADTYSVVSIDDLIEPTIIYDISARDNVVRTAIENILVWDVREWLPELLDFPPITSQEDDQAGARGGIQKCNTLNKSGYATAAPQRGGSGTTVTGAASGTLNVTNGQVVPQSDAAWEFFAFTNEEQDATGQINLPCALHPKNRQQYNPYRDFNEAVRHHLLTHANYYQWLLTNNYGAVVGSQSLGMDARLMSIDIEEMLADRGVILNLADALTILTV